MCDEWTAKDNDLFLARQRKLSRRGFNTLAGSAAFGTVTAIGMSGCAEADRPLEDDIVSLDVDIKTPDGLCNAVFSYPKSGQSAAVLVWPDIMGLRPSFRGIGDRLAREGYASLVVNPYYRKTRERVFGDGDSWGNAETRKNIMPFYKSLSPTTTVIDAKAFIAWLDDQSQVDTNRKLATTGYCMGGPMVMRTAAAASDRIGAGASFHGGGLVTDKPDSPHHLIPNMQASFLIAIAENDDERDPIAKETLKTAFAASGLNAEIEVYEGAMHGWCPPDSAVYNYEQAERAWARMLVLFEKALV